MGTGSKRWIDSRISWNKDLDSRTSASYCYGGGGRYGRFQMLKIVQEGCFYMGEPVRIETLLYFDELLYQVMDPWTKAASKRPV